MPASFSRLPQTANFKSQSLLIHLKSVLPFIGLSSALIGGALWLLSVVFEQSLIPPMTIVNVYGGLLIVLVASSLLMHRVARLPSRRPEAYVLPIVLIGLLLEVTLINAFRLSYSRPALMLGGSLLMLSCWFYFASSSAKQAQNSRFLLLPYGFYQPILDLSGHFHERSIEFSLLTGLEWLNEKTQYSGIVVDGAADIPSQWQRFITQSLASGVPVMNSVDTYESLLGKAPLDDYHELNFSELSPSEIYLLFKRWLETLLIVLTLPLSLPLFLITLCLIKLESPGPAIFTQQRVGQGGKVFTLYKLRSMRLDSEAKGAQFASASDDRITKVGKVIRKLRIDEIPQLWNVVKGDMALIGPRPEQESFVESFEQQIPLYSYRHVVRPGITGWAQVTQGYADDEESTKEKLSYDFYYVKNVSFWLDLHIVIKTIYTILTGFGAR